MSNYILIGMPSSGKTTKGEKIAKQLGLKFADTDSIITKEIGEPPSEIVRKKGREAFIDIQDYIISSKEFNECVISTGGGIIYSNKAMKRLKEQGTVIFLNVPFDILEKRMNPQRKLSSKDGKDLKGIFDERQPIYKSFADIEIICDNKEAQEIIDEIIENITWRD